MGIHSLDNLLGKLPPQESVIREVTKEVIKEIPPKAMLVEVENLKREKQLIWDEREKYRYEYEQLNLYQTQLQEQNNTLNQELGQVKDELSEAESVVQECVEEKKKFSSVNNTELVKAVDTLRDQLNLQKESLQK